MLPSPGTRERDLLEKEAVVLGEQLLEKNEGDLAVTLYEVYSHFRTKFLEERGLMDTTIDSARDEWDDALSDAMGMRHFLNQRWSSQILA